ncbi:MAG: DegT/DnrJ/EryC1/StrS family aminotransferase [Candidatus Solibacter usitatus]|nr:DegT/DnrJ/EryC1/StrS family aminotransferase [Candidatus Solibacter usitatus]
MERRSFVSAAAAATLVSAATDKPAVLGGSPAKVSPVAWPITDETDEKALLNVFRGGKWFRGYGKKVQEFEESYARLTGARHCVAVANGTSALLASLAVLQVGAGDEVILPPYTFVATLNAILERQAIPIFVDVDPATFQIDPARIEAAITPATKAIIPVHMAGAAADLDSILKVANRHRIPVIEDACQAHLGEWKGRKVGTYGVTGCFSFQASNNLNSGEGGAILTNEEEVFLHCSGFHNNGNSSHRPHSYVGNGLNLRMTEFQAALLMAQMTRLEKQSQQRESNAAYLTKMFNEIPGIVPALLYPGCTRNAWHLYMFRYKAAEFDGLSRAQFLNALKAEGIGASSGYSPLNKNPLIDKTFQTRGYQRFLSPAERKQWPDRTNCPQNDKLCGEAVWFTQTMLLGPRSGMETIAGAIRNIRAHAGEVKRKLQG